jgi:hypothetical protein
MNWKLASYVLACVVVPVAWGLLVVWASNRIETFLKRQRSEHRGSEEEASLPPLDYHI